MMFVESDGVLVEQISNGAGPHIVWVEGGKVGDKLTPAKLEKAKKEAVNKEKNKTK